MCVCECGVSVMCVCEGVCGCACMRDSFVKM